MFVLEGQSIGLLYKSFGQTATNNLFQKKKKACTNWNQLIFNKIRECVHMRSKDQKHDCKQERLLMQDSSLSLKKELK